MQVSLSYLLKNYSLRKIKKEQDQGIISGKKILKHKKQFMVITQNRDLQALKKHHGIL